MPPRDARAILALWKSIEALSQDVDVPYQAVHSWRRRNSIPPAHWDAVVSAAKKRGIRGITINLLSALYIARARRN